MAMSKLVIGAALALACVVPRVLAQDNRALREACAQEKPASVEASTAACTAIIQAGQGSKAELAAAYYNRGNNHQSQRRHDEAIADYDQAIKLDPSDPIHFYNRAISWTAKGDHDRAIADYGEAIRLRP